MVPFCFFVEIGPCKYQEIIGYVGERNPHFFTIENVLVTLLDGGCLQTDDI